MLEVLFENLPWLVGLIGLFSFLAVAAWSTERRKEREALYRSEAIKKVAEMAPNIPEAVLKLLHDALTHQNAPNPAMMAPYQIREHYKSVALLKIAESPDGGAAVRAYLEEQQKLQARNTRAGLRLGGAICVAVGAALALFLNALGKVPNLYLVGTIPVAVGVILIFASYSLHRDA